MAKKKSNEINFKRSLKVLKENKTFILAAGFLLIGTAIIGWIYPNLFAAEQEKIMEYLKSFALKKTFLELMPAIILNNLRASFFAMVLGIAFGIFPIIAATVNGYIVGAVMRKAYELTGVQILFFIIPHGIFEIPALVISMGLGIKLGLWVLEKKKKAYLKKCFFDFASVYIFIIMPLLLIAGVVEASLIFFK